MNSTKKLSPDDILYLHVPRHHKQVKSPTQLPPTVATTVPGGSFDDGQDDELLIRRSAKDLSIYDMGIMLDGDRISPAAFVPPSPGLGVVVPPTDPALLAYIHTFENLCTSAAVDNRLPIPFEFTNAYVDVFIIDETTVNRTVLSSPETRPYLFSLYREDPDGPNGDTTNWKAKGSSGIFKSVKGDRYGIESIIYYCFFYSGGGWKATLGPTHDSEDAQFPDFKDIVGLYLMPALGTLTISYNYTTSLGGHGSSLHYGLFPLDSFTDYVFSPPSSDIEPVTQAKIVQMTVDSGLYDILATQVSDNTLTVDPGSTFLTFLPYSTSDQLTALIRTKSRTYYIWRTTTPNPDNDILLMDTFMGLISYVHGVFT